MKRILCTIQQDSIATERIPEVQKALIDSHRSALDVGTPKVIWVTVPAGQAFTDGRPSEMSWLLVEVDDGFDQSRREAALHEIGNAWARATGTSLEQLMLAVCDSSYFSNYQRLNVGRIRPGARPGFVLRTAGRLLATKLRHGYLGFSVNARRV